MNPRAPWLILALALPLDICFGEPPNRWHPVAWLGRGLEWLLKCNLSALRALIGL